ncbi:MAG TPA: hypothetical protein VMG60_10335 [Burkholderiaceae bacterium]|nr:hypothetical protein [Burkholderiaceae bacterium]
MGQALDQLDDNAASRREQRDAEALATETIEWLAGLPEEIRPEELPARFPRIANALARRWIDRDRGRAYLDDILIDKRGTRRGLPDEVAEELAALKDYFETVLYPVPQTAWDEVAERGRKK